MMESCQLFNENSNKRIIKIPDRYGINLGDPNARHALTAILNLACPHSKKWFQDVHQLLIHNVEKGILRVCYKFWNKPKESLFNGNIAQKYIDYQDPQMAVHFIREVFEKQEELRKKSSSEDVIQFLKSALSIGKEADQTIIEGISREVLMANIKSVPTLILDNVAYVGEEQLNRKILESLLKS
ncbi:MAG: thioredoxin domain-containing protein [Sporolactobacillus sp.]